METNPVLPIHNGSIPLLGFGTYGLRGEECRRAVETALECGYRHVDTAADYDNHDGVGAALAARVVPRDEVFLTTKVGARFARHDDLVKAAGEALNELRVDVIDLFLLHWPNPEVPIADTLRGMRKLMDDGVIRNAGVSNFTAARLAEAVDAGIVPISANQVEYHAHLNQRKLLAACREQGVVLTAYSPIARSHVTGDERLSEIGRKYGKSAAQVALRWLFEKGIPAVPKARSRDHVEANLAILDWALTPEDFAAVDNLDRWEREIGWELSGPDDRALNG